MVGGAWRELWRVRGSDSASSPSTDDRSTSDADWLAPPATPWRRDAWPRPSLVARPCRNGQASPAQNDIQRSNQSMKTKDERLKKRRIASHTFETGHFLWMEKLRLSMRGKTTLRDHKGNTKGYFKGK